MTRGRPLRFLGGVVAGWTVLRVIMLSPGELPAPALVATPAVAAPRAAGSLPALNRAMSSIAPATLQPRVVSPNVGSPVTSSAAAASFAGNEPVAPLPGETTPDPPQSSEPAGRLLTPALPVERLAVRPRMAGDSWLVLRPGGGDSLAFGQLGASQGGGRVTYALDADRRVALSVRVSAPVRRAGREAGIGLDLRPTAAPVHLLIEQRFGLDGGGARPAAGIIAGGSLALPGRARLDAYGQGGAVWRRGGFVDAAVTAVRPVLERGGSRVELGGGAWVAAQRRVARFDVGPAAAIVMPLGGRAVRVQLDYRFRIAGKARPGSGPALTLGGSF